MRQASPRPGNSSGGTLWQIAPLAAASHATDSPVPSGGGRTGRAARRGAEHAADLGLAPSASGSLAPKSRSVALVINEATTWIFGDPFFSSLIRGIHDALAERSLLMVLLAPESALDLALTEAYLLEAKVDGVILASLHGPTPLPGRLRKARIPAVFCGLPARGLAASYVDSDNRQGALMAVNHLISLGRRRIATISGNLDMAAAVDRQTGYRDALVAAGLPLDPTLEEVADYSPNRAHMAMERLLLNHPEVDAVFAASDLMAAAAIRVLHQARKRIPEDVAVVGFDDSPTARATRPPLTSVRQPIEEMGCEAVSMLMRQIQEPDEAPRKFIFATELVIRESTIGLRVTGAPD